MNNNQGSQNPEQFKSAPKEGGLNPVTALVAKVLGESVTPLLGSLGLVALANQIFENKLPPTDPNCIKFADECEKLKVATTLQFKEQGKTSQEIAVIANYYDGLIRSVS